MDFKTIMETNRPELAKSTLRNYLSLLINLFKKMNIKIDNYADIEANKKKILDYLKTFEIQQRKTKLSALVVLLDDDKHKNLQNYFRAVMMADLMELKKTEDDQKKTPTQENNWMTLDEIMEKYNELAGDIVHMYKSKKFYYTIELYTILSILLLNPTRRSQDITLLKRRNINEDEHNYIDFKNKKIVYNNFKGSNKKGRQTVDISKELLPILEKWDEYNKVDNDFMFLNLKQTNGMTISELKNMLNTFFGKHISTTMLRHITTSEIFKEYDLKKLDDTAKAMGTSGRTILEQYVKK